MTFRRKKWLTHRIAWLLFRGPIPVGYEVDHLCRVRLCWRPSHLEPVTKNVNIKRGWAVVRKTCQAGHEEWSINSRGHRYCLACERQRYYDKQARAGKEVGPVRIYRRKAA